MTLDLLRLRTRSLPSGVTVVVLTTLAAAAVRAAIGATAPDTVPFAPFILAILLSTLLSGYAAGLAALAAGLVTAWYFFLEPAFSFAWKSHNDVASAALFFAVGLAMIFVGEALRRGFDRETARERRLAKAQESGGVGDWEWDLIAGKITWSDNLYKLMGRDPASFVPSPDNFATFVHPDDFEHVSRTLQDAITNNGRFDGEMRAVWPDGTVRHFVSRGEVVQDKSGTAVRIVATKIDITARRETEIALAASEQRYRLLFNAMSEAYVVHDIVYDEAGTAIDFRAVEANPAFETHTGLSRDIVVGHLASEFAPGGDRYWLGLFAEVVRSGKPSRTERYSPRPQRWVDLRAFPLGGPRLGIVFNDVTQRKLVEAEREASEARLAAAMQVAEVGAFDYDPATATVVSSGSCNAIYGFDDRLTSRPLADYIARIDAADVPLFRAELERALGERDGFAIEYRIRTPGGAVKWIASRGAPVANPAGDPRLVGALFDITARKQNELEREALREHTEVLFREMNHRTKNNLAIIAGMLQLQAAANKDEPNVRRHLDAASERIVTIAELHSSLYQGDILGEIDFADYIRNICTHIEAGLLSSERAIRFVVETEKVSLSADVAIPIGLAVNELVTNAVKHAFDATTHQAAIKVMVYRRNGCLCLSVADNGRGLPEPWSPGRNGLGTRIVDAFVKQVGGQLNVVGHEGTRFEIMIPSRKSATA
jgi:PAS domain S-box-containing protein